MKLVIFFQMLICMLRLQAEGIFTMAFGRPNSYSGKDMREAHAHHIKMGLDDSLGDVVIELLGVGAIASFVHNDVLSY